MGAVGDVGARFLQWSIIGFAPFYARNPGVIGVLALTLATEAMLIPLGSLGQERAALRYYGSRASQARFGRTFGMAFLGALVAGFVGGLALSVLVPTANKSGFSVPLFALSAAGVFSWRYRCAMLQSLEAWRRYALARLVLPGFRLAFVVWAASRGHPIVGWLLFSAAVYAIPMAISIGREMRLGRSRNLPEGTGDSRLIQFGLVMVPHALAGAALVLVDRWILQVLRGEDAVGRYAAAYAIGSALTFGLSAVSTIAEPRLFAVADTMGDSHIIATTSLYGRLLLIAASSLGAAIALFTIVASGTGIPIISDEGALIRLVIAGHLALPAYLAASGVLQARTTATGLAKISAAAAALNVGLNFALIPNLGIHGAALATGLTFITQAVWTTEGARRVVDVDTKTMFAAVAGSVVLLVLAEAPLAFLSVLVVLGGVSVRSLVLDAGVGTAR